MANNSLPVIGITGTFCKNKSGVLMEAVAQRYVKAVRRAGALPLILPPDTLPEHIPTLLHHVDGFLLSGGGDIDPKYYQGERLPSVYGVEPARDLFEIELVRALVAQKVPFLGICRGIQVLNVALGGDLYADIATQTTITEKHKAPTDDRSTPVHKVFIEADSKLAQIMGKSQVSVNSLHHQSIRSAAKVLKVTARSPEGVIEGVEVIGHPFGIAVQWHPEWMEEEHPSMRALFAALTEAARQRAEK